MMNENEQAARWNSVSMKRNEEHEVFIRSGSELERHLSVHGHINRCTIQGIDFGSTDMPWDTLACDQVTLIACSLPEWLEIYLRKKDVMIFPEIEGLPYDPFRSTLYSWQELMAGSPSSNFHSWDEEVYEHFRANRFNPGLREALYQRIHDHAMDDGLRRLMKFDDEGMTNQRAVGMMGGHGTSRTDPFYALAAETARMLSKAGYLVVSGGGPGIMEAANLGAYFGNRSSTELTEAIAHLSTAPGYRDESFNEVAEEVLVQFPNGNESLAIPTWFYGHEPSNLFAAHIAKYFSNSLREDNLLAIALYGVIFAPGSAGTTQEIFQDAAQNHYGTFDFISPMVFLGRQRYEQETQLFPLVKELSSDREYGNMLCLSDSPAEIVDFLIAHPPMKKG